MALAAALACLATATRGGSRAADGPQELQALAKLAPEFEKRNCKIVGLSVDDGASNPSFHGSVRDRVSIIMLHALV